MASILDIGLVNVFGSVFTFMLVYAVVWGLLTWRKPFGDKNAGAYSIIAAMVALLSSIITPIKAFIGFVAPWYVAFIIVLFFILLIVMLFGKSAEKDLPKIIEDSRVYVWIVIVSVVILLAGLAFAFGQSALETGTNQVPQRVPDGTVVIGGSSNLQPPGTVVVQDGTTYQGGAGGVYDANGYPIAGQPGSTNTPDFKTNVFNTLIHPKVLGLLVILVIASLAIYFLSAG